MKVCGIISEYNPFHNGHKYQIEKTREITGCDTVLAVMSGNFTQRGEPALIDKYRRAAMALSSSIDLILELPVLYSVSSAEIFSFGAVSLLDSLNAVDYISFGSESGDIDNLQKIALSLSFESEDYKTKLQNGLKSGLPYHKSRENALSHVLDERLLKDINNPNNILGIEYLKSLIRLKSRILPLTIKRIGAGYKEESIADNYSSASALRKNLNNKDRELLKNNMPEPAFNILNDLMEDGYKFTDIDKMLPYIRYKLYMNPPGIKAIPEVIEGIDNKILKEINTNSFDELILSVKSKRYTYTRIARILTQYFIGFECYDIKEMRKKPCPYIRILGANEKGRKLIRLIKKNSSIPIINKIPINMDAALDLEIKSTKAYSLINKNISPFDDYLIKPIIY